jgi:hypothetical protein
MKYVVDIEIDLPRERVIQIFNEPDNRSKWQEGLLSFEHINGEPGQPGAQMRLVFQMGKRRIEMIETINERNLPDEFHATYDAKCVHNVVRNFFRELGPNKTRWESENEFQFSGFMRLIGLLMRRAFPEQSLKMMRNFKDFAEDGRTVNQAIDSEN